MAKLANLFNEKRIQFMREMDMAWIRGINEPDLAFMWTGRGCSKVINFLRIHKKIGYKIEEKGRVLNLAFKSRSEK